MCQRPPPSGCLPSYFGNAGFEDLVDLEPFGIEVEYLRDPETVDVHKNQCSVSVRLGPVVDFPYVIVADGLGV